MARTNLPDSGGRVFEVGQEVRMTRTIQGHGELEFLTLEEGTEGTIIRRIHATKFDVRFPGKPFDRCIWAHEMEPVQ
jgi:hypothetical protein